MEQTRDQAPVPSKGRGSIWFEHTGNSEIRRRCTMGEKRCRPVSLAGDHARRREFRREQIRPGSLHYGVGGWVVGAAAMLALGLIGVPPAQAQDIPKAQDTPIKNDAAAKAESTPESPTQEAASAEALSLHYRFIERYSATEDPRHPELLTQYRVGLIETQKTEREKQQGAPDRFQVSHRTIYTERVADASKMGDLTSAVRRYDRFKMDEVAPNQRPKIPYFEGLTILYKTQPNHRPLIINLTDDRPLRELEYSRITTQVFMPGLSALLPPTPRLVADTWPIPARAVQSLVGEAPNPEDYEMTGTLVGVRKARAGPALVAIIGISGQMNLPSYGASSLNAELHFVFNPVAAVAPAVGPGTTPGAGDGSAGKRARGPDEGIVNARGHISQVLMAWKATNLLADDEARLKQTRTYELQLERRLVPANDAAAGPKTALTVPIPIPTATEANSWLLYQDPRDRFYLLHPQNLELSPRMIDPNVLELVEQDHGTGKDVFTLTLAPGAAEPQADRDFRDANQFQRKIDAYWAKMKDAETIRGPAGWLPEAEWSPWKVFRKELGIVAGAGVERIYCDDYLVLSKRNECFHVQSMTIREDHVAFRTQSEGIIKSFHFGKWDPQPKAPATAPPAPPATPPN